MWLRRHCVVPARCRTRNLYTKPDLFASVAVLEKLFAPRNEGASISDEQRVVIAEAQVVHAALRKLPVGKDVQVPITHITPVLPEEAMDVISDLDGASPAQILEAHPALFSLSRSLEGKLMVSNADVPCGATFVELLRHIKQTVPLSKARLAMIALDVVTRNAPDPKLVPDVDAIGHRAVRTMNRSAAFAMSRGICVTAENGPDEDLQWDAPLPADERPQGAPSEVQVNALRAVVQQAALHRGWIRAPQSSSPPTPAPRVEVPREAGAPKEFDTLDPELKPLRSFPNSMVPLTPDTLTLLVRRLSEQAADETVVPSVARLAAALSHLASSDPPGMVQGFEAAVKGASEAVWSALDVVTLRDTWNPKTPCPTPELRTGVDAFVCSSEGDEGATHDEDLPVKPTERRDAFAGRRETQEMAWLFEHAAPQKALVEPYCLFSLDANARQSPALRRWAGSAGQPVANADEAERLVEVHPGRARLFFRVLPPFSGIPSDDTTAAFEAYTVPPHEVFRIARTLSAVEHTPLIELVRRGSASVLAPPHDLQHILVTDALRFEFRPPEHEKDAWTGGSVKFLPPISCVRASSADPNDLVTKMQQLRQERRVAEKHRRYRITRKIMDLKKDLVLANHPAPHPFQDPDVLAYFVYDLLPPDSPLQAEVLYSAMPKSARLGAVLTQSFFRRFPHLFSTFDLGVNPTLMYFQRSGLPLPSEKAPADFTEEELLSAVEAPFVFGERDNRSTRVSFVQGRLPKNYRDAIAQRNGSLEHFLAAHPERFQIVSPPSSTEVSVRLKRAKTV